MRNFELNPPSAPVAWDQLPQEYVDPIFQILEQFRYRKYGHDSKNLLLKEIKEKLDSFLKTQQLLRGHRLIVSVPRLDNDVLTVNFAYVNQ